MNKVVKHCRKQKLPTKEKQEEQSFTAWSNKLPNPLKQENVNEKLNNRKAN